MLETLHTNTPVLAETDFAAGDLPGVARVVIVGGGIAGCSVAYQLAQQGWQDVIMVESGKVASGTTWHSAGQVGQLRASASLTKINKASAELYAELGCDAGWLQCGGLQLATCEGRWAQLRRQAALAGVFGVAAELLEPREIAARWPVIETGDVLGGIWLPGDGRVLPGACAVELVRRSGFPVFEDLAVTALLRDGERVAGVRTTRGEAKAEWVVLACGMWSRQLGLGAGVDIPLYPCEHHYVVTAPVGGVTRDFPCGRDPDAGIYFRALDDGGMKLGAFKLRAKPWVVGESVPADFHHDLLEPDWEDFAGPLAAHRRRIPAVEGVEIVKFVNGPESFTPDNQFLMGEPAGTRGLFVLGGFNSAGIACAGGAGMYAAQWMEGGEMPIDLLAVDIRRFRAEQNGTEFLRERVSEVLGLHYAMAWPGRQMETGRDLIRSPLHHRHVESGARFGEVGGVERPLWFGGPQPSYTFGKPEWLGAVAAEVYACRNGVAVFDLSTLAKLTTKDLAGLQWLCANDIDVPVGRCVYTAMLNERGTYESDLVVLRSASDRFGLYCPSASRWRDFDWIRRNGKCEDLRDFTDEVCVLAVMGLRSRELLSSLPGVEREQFSSAAFGYGDVRGEFEIAGACVAAARISYVGELGWELYVPVQSVEVVYDAIKEAGASDAGHHAINAMRLECGFRAFGHELSPDETPYEAGLGFAVASGKVFSGWQALREAPRRKRLLSFVLEDPDIMLWGGEPILLDGEVVGYTSSATFGPTLGASVALGYVRKLVGGGRYEILSTGVACGARASLRAPIDPRRERVLR